MTIPRIPYRRLEVVVLSARGLGDLEETETNECKRLVELAIVSHLDPEGEEFGAKTSPWTLPSEKTSGLRFGRSGLRSIFPLTGPNAPESVESRRFLESAELRIRLMVSGVNNSSNAMLFAQSLLPAPLVGQVAKELDKATAQVEAETRISLADILDKKANTTQSGWVNLQRRLMKGNDLDSVTPQVWIQAYVLPDHQPQVPKLNEEYEAEGLMLPGFRPAPCRSTASLEAEMAPEPATSPVQLPKAPPGAPPAAEQMQAVVPAGVGPGQNFSVTAPRVHMVTCPPGLGPGAKWQVVSPISGQMLEVQVPEGVSEGQPWAIQEDQVFTVSCPPDCGPGSTVRVKPPAIGAPGATPPAVMQVQCPPNMRPGETLQVEVPGSPNALLVEIPPGVLPGQFFAVNPAQVPLSQPPTQPYPGAVPGQAAAPAAPPADLLDAPFAFAAEAPAGPALPPAAAEVPAAAAPPAAADAAAASPADILVPVSFDNEEDAAPTAGSAGLDLAALYSASAASEQPPSPPAKGKAVDRFAPLMAPGALGDEQKSDLAAERAPESTEPECLDALLDSALTKFETNKR